MVTVGLVIVGQLVAVYVLAACHLMLPVARFEKMVTREAVAVDPTKVNTALHAVHDVDAHLLSVRALANFAEGQVVGIVEGRCGQRASEVRYRIIALGRVRCQGHVIHALHAEVDHIRCHAIVADDGRTVLAVVVNADREGVAPKIRERAEAVVDLANGQRTPNVEHRKFESRGNLQLPCVVFVPRLNGNLDFLANARTARLRAIRNTSVTHAIKA